jgi:hypothetical protein
MGRLTSIDRWSQPRFAVGLFGVLGFADQCFDEFIDRFVGDRDHFVVGPVLNRVFYPDRSRVEPEGAALTFGAIDELGGGYEDAGDAAGFEVADVVHTARRATASIG